MNRATLRHAAIVVAAYAAIFCWLFSQQLVENVYLAEADLYDWFLPLFLSPMANWTHEMFAGLPTFADTSDATPYVMHLLFSRVFHSWAGYIISAYVLGAAFMYAYVFNATRSRWAAAVAGLAYSFSDAMLLRHGHINIVHASAWLPLMVLSIDRLIETESTRWIAIGGVAAASCFLSGHPQPLLYAASFCFLYAIAGCVAERADGLTYVRILGMFGLGALMTAVKSLPFVEVTRMMARTDMSYARFVDGSPSPSQLLGVLLPSLRSVGNEAPVYSGIAVLFLATVGVIASPRNWRVLVWLAGGVLAFLIAAGDATPIAHLAYYLPLYGKFRIVSRVLFVLAAAAAALSVFGVAALVARDRRSTVAIAGAAIVVGLGLAIGGWTVSHGARPSGDIVRQAIITAACVAAAFGARRSSRAAVLLALVVAGDLLSNTPYPLTGSGLKLSVEDAANLRPSVHAERLAREAAPTHQRLLALSGSSRDPVVPAAFARLWQIPIAGGYSPIMLARLAEFARMGAPGDVFPDVLAFDDRAVDLLAVRYVIVRDDEYVPPETFARAGLPWARAPLRMTIGRPRCEQQYHRSTSFDLPPAITVASIALVGHLRCAETVAQGAEIGGITIAGSDRPPFRHPIRAGIDLSDRGLGAASVRDRARHQPAQVFDDPELEPDTYEVRIDLPHPIRGGRVTLDAVPSPAWVEIERLTLIDASGRAIPQGAGPLYLSDSRRWREMRKVRTSRRSDRGVDIERDGEQHLTVYENLRALPRAWITPTAVALDDDAAIATVRHSQLPDGRRFDPALMTIVAPGGNTQAFLPGPSTVEIVAIHGGRVEARVSTVNGGHLVLSETYYPGWRARVDDRVVAVQRVNVMFQGVVVPPGDHTVVFELASTTFRVGLAASICAVLIAAAFALRS